MNPRQLDLWQKIRAFQVTPELTTLSFQARLARENRWTLGYAERVFVEYKRFLFLTIEAGHPVTPSDEVDQAWHLHMLYTRSYWDVLCTSVLPRPLHHGPTLGGRDEDTKFHDWYTNTLDSYRRLFNEEPPPDIWPAPAHRFARAPHFARVNTAEHLIIPKPRARSVAAIAAAVLMPAAITGCAAAGTPDVLIVIAIAAILVVLLLGILIARWSRSSSRNDARSGLTRDAESSHPTRSSGCGGILFFPWGTTSTNNEPNAPNAGPTPDAGSNPDAAGDSAASSSSGCSSSGCSSSGCGGGGGD